MGSFAEWKKTIENTNQPTGSFAEWKKTREKNDKPTGSFAEWKKSLYEIPQEDAPADPYAKYKTYDREKGQDNISLLQEYANRAKEINEAIDDLSGDATIEANAKRNSLIMALNQLTKEYNEKTGKSSGSSILSDKGKAAAKTPNFIDNLYVPEENLDFDKLLRDARDFHNKAVKYQDDSKLYESIMSSPDYAAFVENVNNASEKILTGTYGEQLKTLFGSNPGDFNRIKILEEPENKLVFLAGNGRYYTPEDVKEMTLYDERDEDMILPRLMNDQEKTIYNWYYYQLGDKANAEDYYQSIKPELEDRAYQIANENVYLQSKERPGYTYLQSLVRNVYGTPAEFIKDAGNYIIDDFSSKEPVEFDRNRTAENVSVARMGLSEDMSPVEKFFFNTATSGIESALSGLSFGKVAGVALALSACSSTYNEALDKGMDSDDALAYGLAAGLFEGIFESISLGRLLKEVPVDTWVDVVKNLAISSGVNASEEMATEIANLAYDSLANGEFSQWAELKKQGLSWYEILGRFSLQTLEAGASGGLMGLGFGGGQSIVSGVSKVAGTIREGKSVKAKGLTDALIKKGLEYEGTSAYKEALKAQEKATNYRVGRLAETLSKSALQKTFAESVGDSAAKVLTEIVSGREVSKSAISEILGNEKALKALNDTLGTNIKSEEDVKTFRKKVADAVERQTDQAIESLDKNLRESVSELIKGNIVSNDRIKAVINNKDARDLIAWRTGTDITKDSTVQEVKQAVAEANDNNTRASLAVILAASLNMGSNGTSGVANIVANSSMDVARAVQAFNAVYQMGKQGKAISEARNPYLSELSLPQRMAAYEYGVMDGLVEQSESKKKVTKEAEETTIKETDEEAEISRESEVPEGAIVTKGGETIVPVKENTAEQTRIIDMGKKLGVPVAFGKITKNGKNIDGLFDGKVLYINPKTTSGNAAYILFKHEFTHFLEKSTKYKNFAKAVTESKAFSDWIKKKGFASDTEYYNKIIADYKQIGKNLEIGDAENDIGGAQKEAVANFCAEMLYAKDDSMQRFVDTLSPDHKRTFRELIRDFIDWLKKKLGKVDEIAMLEKKYAKLFKDAKKVEAKGVTEKNEVSYSLNVREVNGRSHIVNPYTISKEDVLDYLEMSLRRRLEDNTYFPVSSYTPDTLIYTLQAAGININDKPMAMQAKKAKQSQSKGTPYKKDGVIVRQHEMSAEEIIETIDKISDPNAVIQETNRIKKKKINGKIVVEPASDRFTVVVTLDSGKECVAVIEFDSEMAKDDIVYDGHGEEYHTTVTVFEPDVVRNGMPFDYIEYLLLDQNNRELDIMTESPESDAAYGEHFATANEKGLSNSSIPQKSNLSTDSSKKTSGTDDSQLSYTPSERDTEYLDAVNRGDMETAQRMVDEAAKEAGYDYHLYHGTDADFTVFDLRKYGGQNGKGEGYGIYLAANREVSAPYGKNVIDSYTKFNRLAEGSKKTLSYAEVKKIVKKSCELDAQRAVEDGEYDSVDEAIRDTWVSNVVYTYDYSSMSQVYADVADKLWEQNDNDGELINEIMALSGAHYDYRNALNFYETVLTPTTGIDGFHYIWGNKDGSGVQNDIYLAFSSEQIKSADPVTYDDDGNVIPLSQRFNSENDDIRYSYTPSKEETSTREILANMMEPVAESETEQRLLAKYKGYLERIGNDKSEISRLREERKNASKAKKNVFTSKIEAIERDISDTERRLSKLEEMATIKRLVERERAKLADDATLAGQMAQGRRDAKKIRKAEEDAQHVRDSRDKATEGRHKTQTKKDIVRTMNELYSMLKSNTESKHIHIELQEVVKDALEAIDINAQKEQNYADKIADIDKQIAELSSKGDTGAKYAELIDKRAKIQNNKDNFREKLEKIQAVYRRIENADNISSYYKEEAKLIQDVVKQTMDDVGDVRYEDMSLAQLKSVYKMYRVILQTVRDVNKVIRNGKRENLIAEATNVMTELSEIKKLSEERPAALEAVKDFAWGELTPYYAFERVGSKTLMKYYWDLIKAQNTYARDYKEYQGFAETTREKYGFKKWDLDESHTIKDRDGNDFTMSLKHLMSIYAYSKREQALDHMSQGGFFFNDKETFRKEGKLIKYIRSNETGYRVDERTVADVIAKLNSIDENIISYVDEMQDYLTKMGEKGNEVTREMWGIDVFNEEVYFPLKSKDDFIYQANTPAETSSLKNSGMTKETKPHASNPIVLEGFDDVWADHCERMSKYHAFVIPIDNLNKVLNYGEWMSGEAEPESSIKKDATAKFAKECGIEITDEQILNNAKSIVSMNSVSTLDGSEFAADGKTSLREKVVAFFDKLGNKADTKELGTVTLNKTSFSDDKGHGLTKNKIISFKAIPEVLKEGRVIDVYKPEGKPYIRAIIAAPITINGEKYYMGVMVQKDNQSNRMYLHDVITEKATSSFSNGANHQDGEGIRDEGHLFITSILQKRLSVNITSKNTEKFFSTDSETGARSISTMLTARFGSAANNYLTTFIKDLNGARGQSGKLMTFANNLVSKFKKTAVAASLSVIVQQPTAILRACAVIDPKYFIGLPKATTISNRWNTITKYAPIAIIKDIGGFDAGSGRTATELVNRATKRGRDKLAADVDDITMYGAALGDRIGWGSIWIACEREIAATTKLEVGSEEYFEAVGERFTEIIVKTQVYDSTLSRSGFMREKDGVMKMATSFMGEPTLSFNMMLNALLQAKRGNITKRQVARTWASVIASIIAAGAAKSFIYALRDDDEDESYLEKYLTAFSRSMSFWGELNPLTMIPFVRDIVSTFDGWDVERSDMALISDLKSAIDSFSNENKSFYRKLEDFVGAIGAFAGVPAKNLLRTGREIYSVFENIFDGINGGDLGAAVKEGRVVDMFGVTFGEKKSKSEKLHDAVMNRDEARIDVYRKGYKTESSYESALKNALRTNEPRVQRAVEASLSGNYNLYNSTKRAINAQSNYGIKLINDAFADERDYVLEKLKEARAAKKARNYAEYNRIVDLLVERGYTRAFVLKKLR